MSEIICLHFGQAGVQVGARFWRELLKDGAIGTDGYPTGKANNKDRDIFFYEDEEGRYIPRAVFIDLDSNTIDAVRQSELGRLMQSHQFIAGYEDRYHNYASAHYYAGKEIADEVLEGITLEMRKGEKVDSVLITHSLCGGTGSGGTTLIMSVVKWLIPKVKFITFSVFPSNSYSTSAIEEYNLGLAITDMKEFKKLVICYDNEAISGVANKQLKIQNPTMEDINLLIVQSMLSTVGPFYTNCEEAESSMGESLTGSSCVSKITSDTLFTNIIPYDTVCFAMPSISINYSDSNSTASRSDQILSMTNSVLDLDNCLLGGKVIQENSVQFRRSVGSMLSYRGDINYSEVVKLYPEIREKYKFSAFTLPSFLGTVDRNPGLEYPQFGPPNQSVGLIDNNSAFVNKLEYYNKRFDELYYRRAYVHWFVGDGLEEWQNSRAREDVEAIKRDYEDINFYSDEWLA